MREFDAATASAPEPETMSLTKYEFFTLLGTILGVGIVLGVLIVFSFGQAAADRRAFQAEAAADRRAEDIKMDEFRDRMAEYRNHMQRLGVRYARPEGQRDAGAPR